MIGGSPRALRRFVARRALPARLAAAIAGSVAAGATVAVAALVLAAFAFIAPARAAEAPAPAAAAGVSAVRAVGMVVSDLDRSLEFYTRVLGFEPAGEPIEVAGDAWERFLGLFPVRMRLARVRLGDESLELAEFLAPRGRAVPADSRGNDRWFQHVAIVVRDMDAAYRRLRRFRVEQISPDPQTLPAWNPQAGGIAAFYFRDPDGHPLELIHFPPGKGDPRWARPADHLFLGIDHTAIVVSDTDASLRLYRDLLGLKVAGESENYGIEQERLNAVFGDRLRITGLRAGAGPGIELLEYLAPRDGRPAPADKRSSDLIAWSTILEVGDPARLAGPARAAGATWISPGSVDLPGSGQGLSGLLLRDPDGHDLKLLRLTR